MCLTHSCSFQCRHRRQNHASLHTHTHARTREPWPGPDRLKWTSETHLALHFAQPFTLELLPGTPSSLARPRAGSTRACGRGHSRADFPQRYLTCWARLGRDFAAFAEPVWGLAALQSQHGSNWRVGSWSCPFNRHAAVFVVPHARHRPMLKIQRAGKGTIKPSPSS